ncbi:MAG: AIR synthase family protein [Methanomicrobiales archaeon]|nr:AIR synthase family protein [Methanomicrobiales archaeon]
MDPGRPKIGKIDREVFETFILSRLGRPDPGVLVPPQTGVDAGVVDLGDGRVLIVAEDPIFAIPGQPWEMFGWYTVHIGASDVAVMGVPPRYMTYSLLMPPETGDPVLRAIVDAIHEAALDLGIAIVGGHTGYYPGFAAPTIGGVTVFSIADRDAYVTPAGARPGDAVILTKGPAIETAGILSVLREGELLGRYPEPLVRRAQSLCRQMTVVRDALTAMAAGGVTAMHDATEGGVIGGLAEVAEASGVGMVVDESRFVYPEEVRMVCEAFGIDPVAAIAEGSLIITADAARAGHIIGDLGKAGIAASVIGRVTDDTGDRVMKRLDGSEVPLLMPAQDPFWPVFFEGMK